MVTSGVLLGAETHAPPIRVRGWEVAHAHLNLPWATDGVPTAFRNSSCE